MRGKDRQQQAMFSYLSPEARIPKDHPLRPIRIMVDALAELAPIFQEMYSHTGRPSVPPEQLLRALLLQVLYTIRSERMHRHKADTAASNRRISSHHPTIPRPYPAQIKNISSCIPSSANLSATP